MQHKFRGWSNEESRWVYGDKFKGYAGGSFIREYESKNGDANPNIFHNFKVRADTVSMWTGEIDINKNEIYEGDEVTHRKEFNKWSGIIIFERGTFLLDRDKDGKMLFCCRMDLDYWEIIGNKWNLDVNKN
jgi:hypothetical protein